MFQRSLIKKNRKCLSNFLLDFFQPPSKVLSKHKKAQKQLSTKTYLKLRRANTITGEQMRMSQLVTNGGNNPKGRW